MNRRQFTRVGFSLLIGVCCHSLCASESWVWLLSWPCWSPLLSVWDQLRMCFFHHPIPRYFFVDVWMPQGTDILATESFVSDIEQGLIEYDWPTLIPEMSVTAGVIRLP